VLPGGADDLDQVRVQHRVAAAELEFLHAQRGGLVDRAQRHVQGHVAGIRPPRARPGGEQ